MKRSSLNLCSTTIINTQMKISVQQTPVKWETVTAITTQRLADKWRQWHWPTLPTNKFDHAVASSQRGAIAIPKNGLKEIFSYKNTKFGTGNPHFGEFEGKIEILSAHNLLRLKFSAVCRKIAPSCPVVFQQTTALSSTRTTHRSMLQWRSSICNLKHRDKSRWWNYWIKEHMQSKCKSWKDLACS